MRTRNRAVFTICSNNYVPMARVLLESAQRHHPEAKIYLCLADEMLRETGFYPACCEIVAAETLPMDDFRGFAFRYNIMEFNTALKPYMIRHLLALGHDEVVYLDPDVEVFAPLEHVFVLLDEGASFVLTPHLTAPSKNDEYPDDIAIMRAGIYNLGFLGVGAGEESDRILRWWSRHLQYRCVNAQERGLFVDQRFMDLVPGFADGARILRHAAYNVAYWNLDHRTLTRQADRWFVDGHDLRFFHFSGIQPMDLSLLSKHTNAFRGSDLTAPLQSLIRHYADQVIANGFGSVPSGIYAYGRFASGTPIPDVVRRMFRECHIAWSAGDPFETYEEFLRLPSPRYFRAAAQSVSNFMAYLYERNRTLRTAFDLGDARGIQRYADWFLSKTSRLGIDRRLLEPAAVRIGKNRLQSLHRTVRRPPRKRAADEPDACVIGYLRLALGVGEAGRRVLRALQHPECTARGLPIEHNTQSPRIDCSGIESLFDATATAPVHVFNVNADQMSNVASFLRPVMREDAYRVIMPFWELEAFPSRWLAEFDAVDEVWAPTRFVQAMLARHVPKPVLHMPLPLDFDAPPLAPRAALDLPDDKFLFLFAFDFLSFAERKNPMALVRAFKRAFGDGERRHGVALVLKTLNANAHPEASLALREALGNEAGVILVERSLDRVEMLQLIAGCDAVASLHRSEGLGLLIAEAMALGKPVVATDYSATTELLSPRTGWPVDFALVPVAAGDYPFHEGQYWAAADEDHAAWQMRRVFVDREEASRRAAAGRSHIREQFGVEACGRRMRARLAEIAHA
ncbi:MAG: glycosyltransferase [Rudaea sp.]